MSVATKSYVSSYRNNQHTDEMAQQPRSPASNFVSPQSRMNAPYPSQEPNLKRPSPSGEEGEHRDKRQRLESDGDRMDGEIPRPPTNHERQSAIEYSEDRRDVSANESRIPRPSISMGNGGHSEEAFLLCKSVVPPSRPDASQHLLAMYGLGDLLRSVARSDPFTGEKINKLRKSYEGQIKTFGLPGRNRAEKADRAEDEPGPLRKLALVPDQKWDAEQGRHQIETSPDFLEKLKSAMQIQPGKVRNNAEWEDILGHEKPRINIPPQQNPSARIPNGTPRSATTSSTDKRSTRGKKRSYGDESFVGYGEGYSDMDDEGDDADELARRKRKMHSVGQASQPTR